MRSKVRLRHVSIRWLVRDTGVRIATNEFFTFSDLIKLTYIAYVLYAVLDLLFNLAKCFKTNNNLL